VPATRRAPRIVERIIAALVPPGIASCASGKRT
jgi:hypothetical protein